MIRVSDKLQLIGTSFLSQGLRVLTTLVMARLLSPSDYGAYMLVLALPALIGSMGDFGIPTTLVQLKDASEEAIVDTAFVLGTLLYTVYGLITIGGGFYLSFTHDDRRLLIVAAISATSSLLAEWYNIQLGVLNRRLDFRGESRQNMAFSFSTAAAGVTLAYAGLGVYALALQLLVGQFIANVAVLRVSPLRWPRQFSAVLAKRYIALGGKVSLALYVSNVQGSVTNLVFNHLGGPPALGAWGRATQVQALFGQNLLVSFERVLFPLLCRAADDPQRRRDLFTRSTLLLMLPSAFACAWLIAERYAVVKLVLGPQWDLVPPLLLVAALAIPAGVLYSMGYRMAYALGRTGLMLRAGIVDLCLFLPILAVAWRYGVVAVAAAWVLSKFLNAVLVLAGTWREIAPPTLPLLSKTIGLILSALISGLVMAWVGSRLESELPGMNLLFHFVIASILGLAIYVALVFVTQWELIRGALHLSRVRRAPADTVPPEEDTNALTGSAT